ncbi:MAG: RNA polymerase factor sigma-54, partial [Burkholderiales bacterium]|nr:RNA polymerase factor sigma-54 [Burkholderiales bacterium]
LNQEIERFLQENPLLEREEEEESPPPASPAGEEASIPAATTSTSEVAPQEMPSVQSDWTGDEGYSSYGNPESDDDDT